MAEVPTYHEAKLKIIKHNLLTVITVQIERYPRELLVPLTTFKYLHEWRY